MTTIDEYRAFLAGKAALAPSAGLEVWPDEIHPALKSHQADMVLWGVRGGRRAWFASFGLGKTLVSLEAERLILSKLGGGRGLIVCPLGVRQEFARDARLIGVETQFIRSHTEASAGGIYLTNYESVRDGKLDPRGFDVVSLDEAAILRGFGASKTFRELMRMYEGSAAYRFVATATPSPNEYQELLAYAAFLDIMDVGQARTRFFKRDSTKADHLTLHPHMEREFWLWCSSWGLFLQKPSDLGHDDTGYDLPPLTVRWHEIPSGGPTAKDADRDGQGHLFRNAAAGVTQAAAEKRDSLDARVARVAEIAREEREQDPAGQLVAWCDLNDEQRAIERALAAEGVTASSLYGSQPVEDREVLIEKWRQRETDVFLTKPSMYGAGVNLQQSHTMIFAGITYKFSEVIQGVHRIRRYLQDKPCTVHIVYTEAERSIRAELERKWREHDELVGRMGEIIRAYGLASEAMSQTLVRSIGVRRREVSGPGYHLVNNDTVEESFAVPDNSAGLIITSPPFSTQYEYTPSYNDFGHSQDNAHFWAQMDFLTPQLLRILAPGRVAAIHVKDRITPGGLTGLGFQTVHPFHAEAIFHYRRHGFAFLGMIPVITDVVRENNQTYRLGWTEQCKDGSKMGVGSPEYILLFRKPPTDSSDGYADVPVVKDKATYSRSRWQTDAHGFWRSDGDRPLLPGELETLPHAEIFKRFRDHYTASVYDYEAHVAAGEVMEAQAAAADRVHAAAAAQLERPGVDRRGQDADAQHAAGAERPAAASLPDRLRHRQPAHHPVLHRRRDGFRPVHGARHRALHGAEDGPPRRRCRAQSAVLR